MIYEPHDYQKYAINFIKENPIAAVLLDMGLGKTSITLTAINDLLFDSFDVRKVLVIAPLRVARDTWPAEVDKWDHLRHLICSVAVGTEAERKAALRKEAHIYIINRENVSWLIEDSGIPFDFDMVVIDELSSFKNGKAKRFKSLLKVRPFVKRIVGLTGTPAGNGLMDLWAEFRVLDMGKRLGRFMDSSDSIRRWNNGELSVALIHPASAGHGLNLQSGGSTIVWFGMTWSLELYSQTNARLWRQGQTADTVVVMHIITAGTIDEDILKALQRKDKTQSALIAAVKANL